MRSSAVHALRRSSRPHVALPSRVGREYPPSARKRRATCVTWIARARRRPRTATGRRGVRSAPGPAVGIDEQAVDGPGPPTRVPRHRARADGAGAGRADGDRSRPARCHASSASAAARKAANPDAGSTRSASSPSARPRCSRHSRRRVSRASRRARSPSRRPDAAGRASSNVGVEHRARHLGVVGPRTAVEVVGADLEPDVVDDADLGVHVDRGAGLVLEVVDRDAVAARRRTACARTRCRPMVSDASATVPLCSGKRGTTAMTWSSGARRSASASASRRVRRPQVLVLEVDEPARPTQRLAVGAPDAALAVGRERERRPLGRIRAQDLHRVRSRPAADPAAPAGAGPGGAAGR